MLSRHMQKNYNGYEEVNNIEKTKPKRNCVIKNMFAKEKDFIWLLWGYKSFK